MKITNLDKGEAYQLSPDTQLTVERTNPFFNEYGEQTVPCNLPASPHNCRLTDHPETFGIKKRFSMVDAYIQDGEFTAHCRQAILSAQRHGSIATSFYMNDGSFYSRLGDTRLKDIWTGSHEKAYVFDGMNNLLAFCRQLQYNTNPCYAIFPVLLDDDSGRDDGYNYKILNNYGCWEPYDDKGNLRFVPFSTAGVADFMNAQRCVEYVDGIPITLEPGYYISPFIRANYVLQRIFAYFGYTLQDNFFTQTEPFSKMVVINNCIDTIVNGKLLNRDLVPDVTCKEFLNVFRKKFCCEFQADEATRTVTVVFLKDVLSSAPAADLTQYMTEEPTFSYKQQKEYKRVRLTSKEHLDAEADNSYDTLAAMLDDNETAYFSPYDGSFYKDGWAGDVAVHTKLGECSQVYDTGEETETEDVEVPDCMPEYRRLVYTTSDNFKLLGGQILYIGGYNTMHSQIVVASGESPTEESSKGQAAQNIMLAFVHQSSGAGCAGSLSNYDITSHVLPYPRLWDYSLFYWGADGIFERFYRDMDTLQRNTLNNLKVKLLLSTTEKMNLPATAKVTLRSVEFFLDKLKFTIGGRDNPVESQLRSLTFADDVVTAKTIENLLPMMTTGYKWVLRVEETELTQNTYNGAASSLKERTFNTIYPPLPTAALAGTTYGEQIALLYEGKKIHGGLVFETTYHYSQVRVWLECVKK